MVKIYLQTICLMILHERGLPMKSPKKPPLLLLPIFLIMFLNIHTFMEWRLLKSKLETFISQAKKVENYTRSDVGSTGDINVTFEAVNPYVAFYVGGHAALVKDSESCIETTGLDAFGTNKVKYRKNNWSTRHDFVIGLSVKDASEEEKIIAAKLGDEILGKPYDFTFMPFNNTYYCTEVITYAWNKLNYNLNHDMIGITVQDLVVSPLTEISYLHFRDPNGNKVTYVLQD